MAGDRLVELAKRLNGIAIVSSDITDNDLAGLDVEAVAAYATGLFNSASGPGILDRDVLEKLKEMSQSAQAPAQVETEKKHYFVSSAREMASEYSTRNMTSNKISSSVTDFVDYFSDRLDRLKSIIEKGRSIKLLGAVNNIESLKQYSNGREVSVIGMVMDKRMTKNGNLMVTIDDRSGSAKIIFVNTGKGSREAMDLFSEAEKIVSDEVIAVRGKIASPFVIANSLVRPDIPIRARKQAKDDIAIAFMSDIHVGSKLFLEKQFGRFLEWINGNLDYRTELASKVKYMIISGDLVDGIGVYPNQERELAIDDIYKQYTSLFTMITKIPSYIEVFMIAGNHDAVQRAEPQPELTHDLLGDFSLKNVHLVSNPGYIDVGGLKVLAYHGTSLDSVIQGIPSCSYSKPEMAMVEVLKRRHLSPIYGDNPIVPSKRDPMVVDEVPDILHMGHLHKNGYTDYHGTLVVNSGTWQARTAYQVKLGHMPTPAVLPVYEAMTMNMSTLDFNNFV